MLSTLLLFLASAALVVRSGLAMAGAGDVIAERTGLGRLWVGTVLLAVATSLPELVTNIAAVRLDAPELAGGNIFGANMMNIAVIAGLASLFGAASIQAVRRDQIVLILTALLLTGIAVVTTALKPPWALGWVSLGSLFILAGYPLGMALVYRVRVQEVAAADPAGPLRRAWWTFALAVAGVLIGAPALAFSADQLAHLMGISGSFMGVLAVAAVTTMPEAAVTFGALRRRSQALAVGNVYGSCAFNVFILGIVDPLYTPKPLFHAFDASHIAAGLGALLLMGLGLGFLHLRAQGRLVSTRLLAFLIVAGWMSALYLVFLLGQRAGS